MDMPKPRKPYLCRQITRHGKTVWYVRIGKGPRIRLTARYGTEEFNEQYKDALEGKKPSEKLDNNSIKWLVDQYKLSMDWKSLAASTRKQRDTFLYQMIRARGSEPYRALKSIHLQKSVDNRSTTPATAKSFLKAMRGLFKWSKKVGYTENIASDLTPVPYKSGGFIPWSEEDVKQFQEFWPVGSRERLAMELLLWTGLRRGDIVRLGRQHIKNGIATIIAEKNGVEVTFLIPDHLQAIIDATPTGDLAFIATSRGLPRCKEGFGNWFGDCARQAGLKRRTAHGLRKSAAELLAYAGGTNNELRATFGWTSDYETKRYTEKADRRRLGLHAAKKRLESGSIPSPYTPVRATDKKDKLKQDVIK